MSTYYFYSSMPGYISVKPISIPPFFNAGL